MALPYAVKGISKLVGGDSDDDKGRAAPGHGEGRRMPIQQAVDVAVPVTVARMARERRDRGTDTKGVVR